MTWTRTRVGRVATVNARIGWKALTASEYQPDGYVFLATPNIKSESIDFENVNYISEYRYHESPELKLQLGDVLLAKDGNTLGITNIVRELPRPATVNGSIAVLRPFDIEPRFLRYALAGSSTQGMIDAIKGGMGVPHLFQWDIKRLPLDLPPLDEQRRIADFLDAETARIDKLAGLQQSVLEKIHQRDRAVRDNLVDDLVEKVGELPLRRYPPRIEQGSSPSCENHPREPGQWGVLKLSAIKQGKFFPDENKQLPDDIEPVLEYEVRDGDLLVTRANTPELVGDTAVVSGVGQRLLLPDLIYRVGLDQRITAEFAAQVFLSTRVRSLIQATARGSSQSMVKLRGEDIREWPVPRADAEEQARLVAAIDDQLQSSDKLRTTINRQLALLAERRQALITAAVTGGITV
jgi:type I restriction enzyme, S subunit